MRAAPTRLAAALAALLLAGCADPAPAAPEAPAPAPPEPAGDLPSLPQRQEWAFDTPGDDKEASLAAHPTDPARAAVTWAANIRQVWVAITADGGATWRQAGLDDGSCDVAATAGLPCQRGFDAVAAYAPDGALLVMFGRGGGPDGISGAGMTLARSADDGATWAYHSVTGAAEPHGWDAMDLAVAPDTGHLAVVAQSIAHRSIGLWRSADRGVTWDGPTFPVLDAAAGLGGEGERTTAIFWPRVAAGPRGLLVLTAKSFEGPALRVAASHDGGATFLPWQAFDVEDSGVYIGDPAAIAPDGERVELVFGGSDTLWRASSGDRGASWTGLEPFAKVPTDRRVSWPVSALGRDGRLHTLASVADGTGSNWGVVLASEGPGGAGIVQELASSTLRKPAPMGAGDEYGGLAVAADGALWAAWGDPRGGEVTRVTATRIP